MKGLIPITCKYIVTISYIHIAIPSNLPEESAIYVTILPFIFLGWNENLPLAIIFTVSWILLLTTFSIFINTAIFKESKHQVCRKKTEFIFLLYLYVSLYL